MPVIRRPTAGTRAAAAVLAATGLAGCGAWDEAAPSYGDRGPACPAVEDHISGLLAALDGGRARRLRAAVEAGLDDRLAGRLVEAAAAVARALPDEPVAAVLGPPGVRAGADALAGPAAVALRAVAASPDLSALAARVGPVLVRCNLAPVLRAGAGVLRDPRLPAVMAAVAASLRDGATVAALRDALLATPEQRAGWPDLAVPLLCLLRNTEEDLSDVRRLVVALLGTRAQAPPLSDALDGALALLAPGGTAREAAGEWVGCYVARPPGPDAWSCPYPLPPVAPDPDAVAVRILWDVLSAFTIAPPPPDARTEAGPDDGAVTAVAAVAAQMLDALADEPHLARAWADVLGGLLAAPGADGALLDVADLLDGGALGEVLDALAAASAGCGG